MLKCAVKWSNNSDRGVRTWAIINSLCNNTCLLCIYYLNNKKISKEKAILVISGVRSHLTHTYFIKHVLCRCLHQA